jgi:phenylacetate-CoA ligase
MPEPLRDLLAAILPGNRFYTSKFASIDPKRVELQQLPFTTKAELLADQQAHPPYGTALTFERVRYSRMHQTSGTTTGQPLRWLDTPESWMWMLGCWRRIFTLIGLKHDDRLFFPFSFGPFLGFWTAFESAVREGHFCLPGGGMSSSARLRFLLDHDATVVFCTPTYALHLAQTASAEGIDLKASSVRMLVLAGEPGGNIPETRRRIELAWGARVIDHSGMTEVGPVAVEPFDRAGGLLVLNDYYIAEVIDPATEKSIPSGSMGELVLTNLGRTGSPLIRYRTGDLVRPEFGSDGQVWLAGGILGRVDDMIHVRGNNVYPSAIEAIIRRFPEIAEYRVVVDRSGPLTALRLEIECVPPAAESIIVDRVGKALRDDLLFRADVVALPTGSLPRFEMKAQRFVFDRMNSPQ